MWVAAQVVLLVGFCVGLVKSTGLVVGTIKRLARWTGMGSFGLTAFILALATSLPELMVGITASLEGLSSVVLGNVLGSNIADISLVIGGAAVAAGSLRVTGEALKRDLYLTFGAAILPLLLIEDLTLSRSDGVVLLVVYVLFVATILRKHNRAIGEHALAEGSVRRLLLTVTRRGGRGEAGRFVLGVIGLLVSSHMIVQLSKVIALGLGLPVLLIGLFLVGVGTSLPELVFEMKAVRQGYILMAFGDLLGSVVANATLVLGVSAVICPISIAGNGGLDPYTLAIGTLVVLYGLLIAFARSKSRLEWWEGIILIMLYFAFVVIELGRV